MSESVTTHQELTPAGLQERADACFLFARLFREALTQELLKEIVQRRLLSKADPQWLNQAEAIAVEYARLFAVPGDQAVHPYESVYCDMLTIDTSTGSSAYFPARPGSSPRAGGESEPQPRGVTGFLGGSSAAAVREVYRQAGFALDPACHELPDHIAIELEFMGQLLARGSLDEAKAFFTGHLGRPARLSGQQEAGGWVFRVLEDVAQKTSSGFYQTVADSLSTFLRLERSYLK